MDLVQHRSNSSGNLTRCLHPCRYLGHHVVARISTFRLPHMSFHCSDSPTNQCCIQGSRTTMAEADTIPLTIVAFTTPSRR